jgi:hypothetical protein
MDYNKKNKFIKKITFYSIFFVIVFSVVGIKIVNAEWIEPSSQPPSEVFYAPITTTSEPQAKDGYLLIDPVDYHPSDDSSLGFNIDKPLVVRGEGINFETQNVYNDKLIVNTDTLYVDPFLYADPWVGIGTTSRVSNEKLTIFGQTVQIGTSDDPINERALSSYSADDVGIYVETGGISRAGIYAIKTSNNSRAIYGQSLGSNVGVRGESTYGYGIYASTDSTNYGAVYGSNSGSGFAGYFDGPVNSVSDMIADVFLPRKLQKSLISYVSGNHVSSTPIGNFPPAEISGGNVIFDGDYVWVGVNNGRDTNDVELFKVRASDGVLMDSFAIPDAWSILEMEFDGRYIWILGYYANITRFDTVTGTSIYLDDTDSGLVPGGAENIELIKVGDEIYLFVGENIAGGNDLIIIKTSAFDGWTDIDDLREIINLDPWATNVKEIVSDGEYIWLGDITGENLVRMWAEDPDQNVDTTHPVLTIDMTTADYCHANKQETIL